MKLRCALSTPGWLCFALVFAVACPSAAQSETAEPQPPTPPPAPPTSPPPSETPSEPPPDAAPEQAASGGPLLPGDAKTPSPPEPGTSETTTPKASPAHKASAEAKPADKAAAEAKKVRARHNAESAFVHLYVNFPNAWLELSSTVDEGGFRRVCPAPCDVPVRVAGKEARVVAPGMTPSNAFRIEPGRGTAQFRVDGGSESTKQWGVIAFSAGIPVALGGMGLWGYGKAKDSQALQTTGIIVLGVGAVSVLGSLPLLASGSTRVRDARGRSIAQSSVAPRF